MTEAVPTGAQPDFADWVGRRSERADVISQRMVDSFHATLTPHLAHRPGAPLGIHWCLAPDIVVPPDLGPDGHPRTGLFLPALPYTRRMWAGGELAFHGCFAVGDVVTKTTTIADIAFKTGSTGGLAFVKVQHEYRVGGELVLAERQDVVYRDAGGTSPKTRSAAPPETPVPPLKSWVVTPDPTLLFRYSALTFNGHRIHYDRQYAVEDEGYDGLVVHGPMQATLLLNLAAEVSGADPKRFGYRSLAPVACGVTLQAEADKQHNGSCQLRIQSRDGIVAMIATSALDG